jgi:hypothetical protein
MTTITVLINRHRDLYALTDRLYAAGGDPATDTAEYNSAIEETIELEHRIVAARATSRADIAAKWAFIKRTDFVSGTPGLDTGDLHRLVAMILRLDVETVGASIPELEAEGIAA